MLFRGYKTRLAASILIVPTFIIISAAVIFARSAEKTPSSKTSIGDPYHGDNWSHYERGMEFLNNKKYANARQEFNYYLHHPEMHRRMFGVAWFGKGLVFLARGDDDGAIFAFKQAINNDIHPLVKISDKAYINMGNIFYKKKAYMDSNKFYLKAAESNPRSGLAHYYLGLSYFEIGEYEKATKEAEIAKQLGVTFTALSDKLSEMKSSARKTSP
jgi:tetratricopeptide (TPR) repeat protein